MSRSFVWAVEGGGLGFVKVTALSRGCSSYRPINLARSRLRGQA